MAKSILQATKECFLCRQQAEAAGYYGELRNTGLQKHYVIFGTGNRKKAEHYGLWLYLCVAHHEYGPEAAHTNAEVRRRLSRYAQMEFEKRYSHDLWMEEFGRNWLDGAE